MTLVHCNRHGAILSEDPKACPECETANRLRDEINERRKARGLTPIESRHFYNLPSSIPEKTLQAKK